jgi:hypothetical protein
LSGFVGVKSVHGRYAWSWKPAVNAPYNDDSGMITPLGNYQKLDAGISFNIKNKYTISLNTYNLLKQDIESLDDAYTVIKGEPTFKISFKYHL